MPSTVLLDVSNIELYNNVKVYYNSESFVI